MMFDLSPEQLALRERARRFARERVAPLAADIDARGEIGDALMLDAAELDAQTSTLVDAAIVSEELAVEGPAIAVARLLGRAVTDAPGLRGAALSVEDAAVQESARLRVHTAAIAVGIARAAVEEQVTELKRTSARPTGNPDEPPHWLVADVATEVEAARLLTLRAAQHAGEDRGLAAAATAHVFATEVAVRAVEAAFRVLGASTYVRGARLERLQRDARALILFFGGVDRQRAIAADGGLPQLG